MSQALDPGDGISSSASYFLRTGNSEEVWIKVEAATTIRAGETVEDAWYRLTDMLDSRMEQRINEVRNS
jgi:hypothetical protein